jgi:hypothetical protein
MTKIPGVILAGGLARRMGGGDKPMRSIAKQANEPERPKRVRPWLKP